MSPRPLPTLCSSQSSRALLLFAILTLFTSRFKLRSGMSQKVALLMLALLCVYTLAMVPRHRFARDTDKEICSGQTPCKWVIYKPPSKDPLMTVDNTYCTCGDDTICTQDKDQVDAQAFVFTCKRDLRK